MEKTSCGRHQTLWKDQKNMVENILRHRRKGKGYSYLIRWKGYTANDDSWEPEKNLEHAEEVLENYKERHGLT